MLWVHVCMCMCMCVCVGVKRKAIHTSYNGLLWASHELDLILYADNFLLVGREGVLMVREDCDQKGVLGVGQWVKIWMSYK